MFCPNCGSNIPENSGFCPNCGSQVINENVTQDYAAPQNANTYYAPQPAGMASTKKEFVSNYAAPVIQKRAKVGKLLAVVSLLLMLLSYVITMNTSIEKIPIVKTALKASGVSGDMEDAKDDLYDMIDELEERFEEEEDELEDMFSKKEIKNLKQFIKTAKKCAKSLSVSNIQNLMKSFDKLVDSDMEDYMDLNRSAMDGVEEANEVLDGVRSFFLIGALICAAFVCLGGLGRVTALVSIGMVFSFIYCILFCGVLLLLVNLAAHIALIVCCSSVNKAYKLHQMQAAVAR